jgi:copper resistance protein C
MKRRLLTAVAGAAAAIVLAVLPAAGASAHDYLVSTDPAADSTVTTPIGSVTLTFNAPVLDLSGDGTGTLLIVTGPDAAARHFETGCAAVSGSTITAPVSLGVGGRYTVTYQAVSSDGHTVPRAPRRPLARTPPPAARRQRQPPSRP